MTDREKLIYDLGWYLGYLTGHKEGWKRAAAWQAAYFKTADCFAEATAAGVYIALKRENVSFDQVQRSVDFFGLDEDRATELCSWFGRIGCQDDSSVIETNSMP